jgi:hypothetical protein
LFTGISSRGAALVVAAAVLLAFGTSQAQSLKLASLSLPADVRSGSWISYQVTVDAKNRPPRRFTQRLAVVSREGSGEESGVWVELKRVESGKTRLERGFFARPEHESPSDDAPPDAVTPDAVPSHPAPSGAAPRLRLARYQRLTPEGKLLEYVVGDEGAPLPDEDISAMDLLEFSGGASSDSLAPDTLRTGRKVIPCRVRRYRRYGKEDWQGDDTTSVNRVVMTRTVYSNPGIPVTGYARTIVEVSTERVSAAGAPGAPAPDAGAAGATAPADSAGVAATSRRMAPGGQGLIYRADVTLLDLGNDAVPEITQAPEPAPQDATPRERRVIK